MKSKIGSFLIPLAILALSCSNSAGSVSDHASTNSDAKPVGGAKGTITCNIDGKPVTITVMNSFFDITLDPYSKGPKDGVELLDGSKKKEGFQFELKKEGVTVFRGMAGVNTLLTYFNAQGAQYLPDEDSDVKAVVTSYSPTHVAGTFSGKFKRYEGSPANTGPDAIVITNGKFDLTN